MSAAAPASKPPVATVSAPVINQPQPTVVRPRVTQLIDTLPAAPRDELSQPTESATPVTKAPVVTAQQPTQIIQQHQVIRQPTQVIHRQQPQIIRQQTQVIRQHQPQVIRHQQPQIIRQQQPQVINQIAGLRTSQPSLIRTIPSVAGQHGVTVVRGVRPVQPGTVVRTVRAVTSGGQQIIRAVQAGGTAGQQILRTVQQVKGANGPIQIIQTQKGGSPITISSSPQIVVCQNNSVQMKTVPQTVQLSGMGNSQQPRIATILSSAGLTNNPQQTISLLNAVRGGTPTTSNNVTRIPAKIVQQIGPDGTTRTVRIVTVSPGMLQQQQQQGATKGITVTKVAPGGATLPGTATIRFPQRTTNLVRANTMPVVRPSIAQGQKLTIAPRPGGGNKLVVTSSVPTLNPLLQNRVIQPIKRAGSPLTVNAISNTISNASRAKAGTPPPATNGVIKTQLSEKDVSRLWANDEIKFKKLVRPTVSVFYGYHLY